MKFTLSLNSHALSNYQECEGKYLYTNLIGIEGLGNKFAMDRGTLFAKFLEIYYKHRLKPRKSTVKVLNNPIVWTRRIQKNLNLKESEAFSLYQTMKGYVQHWKGQDWTPLAVEKGFSKILYEDSDNLFVWEGRPDLIGSLSNGETIVCDHKTQAQTRSYYAFNNQARGYLWATGATKFVYNYITMLKTPVFRREAHSFTEAQIEDWKSNTIEWFFRIKKSLQDEKFPLSWNCEGKFGTCPFHLICEQPLDTRKAYVIKTQYKKRKLYRSW
jgi:hypothetical protein